MTSLNKVGIVGLESVLEYEYFQMIIQRKMQLLLKKENYIDPDVFATLFCFANETAQPVVVDLQGLPW